MARIALEHVSKEFSTPEGQPLRAVWDLCLEVAEGERLVLVGPSGCGKTTTLRLLAGLDKPTAGKITFDGKVMNDAPPKARDLAMVFQNPALYPHLSVFDNLAFGLKLRKLPRAEIQERVKQAAQTLGLMDCLQRLPMALSGGQRRRVAIGRALARHPALFLFDEPLSDLDAQTRAQLRAELVALHDRLGCTMIYVTHDQAEALSLGHRVGVMKGGALQQIAEPLKLYRQPANLFVAGFIGSPGMNFVNGTLTPRGNTLCFQPDAASLGGGNIAFEVIDSAMARLESHGEKPVVLGLRPEHVLISPPENSGGQAVLAAVCGVELAGPDIFARAICTGGTQTLSIRVPSSMDLRPGQMLSVTLAMEHAHFFDASSGQALR